MSHRTLRHSYTWLAPLYDRIVGTPTASARRLSLTRIPAHAGLKILLPGIGTGLDCPWLPPGNDYTGLDLTRAMLERLECPHIFRVEGDSQNLPFADQTFDVVVLHLILAVSPQPRSCLSESVRVLKPGGSLLILDKFLQPGRAAPLRRLVSPLLGLLATRTDVELEPLLQRHVELEMIRDEGALLGGWFRRIELQKRAT